MKIWKTALIVAAFAAYASADFEEDEDDYGSTEQSYENEYEDSYEAANEDSDDADEYSSTAKSVRTSKAADEEEAPKAEKKSSDTGISMEEFLQKPLHFGMHVGLGFAGTWGNEEVLGMYDPETFDLSVADPFDGYLGVNVDIGFIVHYRINEMFSFVPEVNIRILEYFKESEVWYLRVNQGWYYSREPLDENMLLVDISIPLMARYNPIPMFYVEAGIQFNLNLYGDFSLSNEDYDYEESMGDWEGETFGFGFNIGAGVTLPLKKYMADIGLRLAMDLTRMEADQMVYNAANNTYRLPVKTRAWAIQLVTNMYF